MENHIEVRLNWLIRRACDQVGITPDQIYKRPNKREKVLARSIVWHNLQKNTNLSLQSLAEIFHKDHATVIHAKKVYANEGHTNKQWDENCEIIQRDFENEFIRLIDGDALYDEIKRTIWDRTVIASKNNKDVGQILLGV